MDAQVVQTCREIQGVFLMLKKISDWIAGVCRWLWQVYLLVMLIVLAVASVIAFITGITWCVIKLLTVLP